MNGEGCDVTYLSWEWVRGGISEGLQLSKLVKEVSSSNKHVGVLGKVWLRDGLQGKSNP